MHKIIVLAFISRAGSANSLDGVRAYRPHFALHPVRSIDAICRDEHDATKLLVKRVKLLTSESHKDGLAHQK